MLLLYRIDANDQEVGWLVVFDNFCLFNIAIFSFY
jgi:hypothetical protein